MTSVSFRPTTLGVKANQQTLSPDLSTDGSRIAFNSNGSNMDPADPDEQPDVYVKDIASGVLTLASVTAAGVKGDRSAQWPSLSSDGMIVAFETHALNLDPRDAGASVSSDIYVKDLSSGSLSLATTSDAGDKGDGESFAPDLSQTGQRVSFISIATGLDPLDPDTLWDVYVKDLVTDDITLASISGPVRKASGLSDHAAISPDGAAIAFDSTAANLDPRDTDALVDVYVKELSSGRTLLVSMSWDGHKANGHSTLPTLSSGGQVVAFASNATNLDPADTDALGDIFVREPVAHNTLQLMSTSSTGQKGDGASNRPSLSADGLSVAFYSTATNLHPDDGDASFDVFVKDRRNGELRLASASTAGVKGIGDSLDPSLSGDGTKVAFESEAQMDPADTDTLSDVYVKDLVSGELVLASTSSTGVKGTAHSMSASISGDGTAVAFFTLSQLDPADTDAFYDVYVKDLVTGATLLASRTAAGADITGDSKAPRLSADGDRVSFSSNAPDLHPADADAFYDVFVKDLVTGEVTLASVGAGGKGNDDSVEPRLAGDGLAVVFVSDATNLDPLDPDPSSDIYLTRIQSSVPDLTIDTSRPAASSIARYGRFEKEFTLSRAFALDKVHDPAIIDVTATFTCAEWRELHGSGLLRHRLHAPARDRYRRNGALRPGARHGVGRLARPVLAGRDRHVAVHAPCPGQATRPDRHRGLGRDDILGDGVVGQGPGRARPARRSIPSLQRWDPLLPHGPERRVRRREPVQRWQPLLRATLPVDAGRRPELGPRLDDRLLHHRDRMERDALVRTVRGRR